LPNHDEAEKLDKLMTQACEHASNKCKKRRSDYWNITIHEKKRDLSVWCQFKNRRVRKLSSSALIYLVSELGLGMSEGIPMDKFDAQKETLLAVVEELHKNSDNTSD
jgi:hypothetical protein